MLSLSELLRLLWPWCFFTAIRYATYLDQVQEQAKVILMVNRESGAEALEQKTKGAGDRGRA